MDISEALKTIHPSTLILIILGLLYVLKFLFKDKLDAMREQSQAVKELTLAIVELKIEIKNLKEVVKHIPKMQEDIHMAFQKLRDLDN